MIVGSIKKTVLVDWSGRCETLWELWTGETPQALATRRLTAHPTESEHPVAEINPHNTNYRATRII
ncbi:hypothetical protein CJ195_12780 [Bacillus sp. UMB0899]|nr:hypothetical protein CJ195_12780 [Bacillus sp. UMB0899]